MKPDHILIEGGAPALLQDPARGFAHFGEFAMAVRKARASEPASHDERLRIIAAAPTTFAQEDFGPDGGFAVPPIYASEIWTVANSQNALIPWTDSIAIGGNVMSLPKDESLPWGTDGVRAYWQAEGGAGTQTKPKLSNGLLRMNKLVALVPLSNELLDDAIALGSYLPKRCGMSIQWKTNDAILFGTGNGTPLGCFNGPAAIIQAKEAAQATATLDPNNFRGMVGRLPPMSYARSIWIAGPDTLKPLLALNMGSFFFDDLDPGDAQPPGLTGPLFKILGRPLFESQHTAALGAQGDICLLDLSYYWTITRIGDPVLASSIHLFFDADVTAFRVTFKLDGQPKIVSPMGQAHGAATLSPFIQLAARP